MKGFGSGLVWGGVLGAVGLVIVSEVSPMPGGGLEPADAVIPAELATAPESAPGASEAVPEAPGDPESQDTERLPEAVVPTEEPAVVATTEPESEPAVDNDIVPPAGSEFLRPAPEADPIVPEAATAPGAAGAPKVAEPSDPVTLPAGDTQSGGVPQLDLAIPAAPALPDAPSSPPTMAGLDSPSVLPGIIEVPEPPGAEAAPSAAELPPPPPLTAEEEALVQTAPEIYPEGSEALLPSDPPLVSVDPLPGGTGADAPAAGFSGEVAGVTVGRLPRIGDNAPGAAAVDQPAESTPIRQYARRFDNPEGKPVFAIILIDDGDPALDRQSLASLPFPVTFALDPTLPGVESLAAPYLGAGQEVVMLASAIPPGATAGDLEVTFAAHAAALPQAVAVMDMPEGGFQNDRPLATQLIPIVEGQGRGLLTFDQGLNPADQVASREGLAAARIFRRLDAEGESKAAIRRYLDRAAFKAAQDGRVAVVGTTRPETIAALMEWSLEGRAAAVALAPVTAVLSER